MKKMIGLLLVLLLAAVCASALADVEISAANFPDAFFRNYVDEHFDTVDDNRLSDAEIAAAREIDVQCQKENVTSLKGIEYLTALESLNCHFTHITELDVSKNTNLTSLKCSATHIKKLDVSNNTRLVVLDVYGCGGMTELDVSRCGVLEELYLNGCTAVRKLTLGMHPALHMLYTNGNYLKTLDIGGCPRLIQVVQHPESVDNMETYLRWNDSESELTADRITTVKSGSTVLVEASVVYSVLDKIELSVKVPAAGSALKDNPIRNAVSLPDGSHLEFSWDSTFWFDETGNNPAAADYTFRAGKTYYMAVMLFAEGGYEIADDVRVVFNDQNVSLFDIDVHNYAGGSGATLNGALLNVAVKIPDGEQPSGTVTVSGAEYVVDSAKKTAVYKAPVNQSVKSVKIPDTITVKGSKGKYRVTEIAAGAFKGCGKLAKVTIGKNVTKIGKNAFNGCSALKTITIKTVSLKTVGGSAFKNISAKAVFKCPAGKRAAYEKLIRKKGKAPKTVRFK